MKKSDTKKKSAKSKAAAPAQPAASVFRVPIDLAANQLKPAPWNPRHEITPASVADLTASIGKDGLIQRIVVVKDGDDYIVVAGNRRLVACREAGLHPIPCELLAVSMEQAKRITFLENLQRRDADPILESDLVAMLVNDGMTLAEIAAETGRGDRWVARRANLRNLSAEWRKRVSGGLAITTDCLERIAAYPADIQEAAAKDFGTTVYYDRNRVVRWNDVSRDFNYRCRSLISAPFDRRNCLKCASNSACAPLLFDDESERSDKGKKYGSCMNAKCYERLYAEYVETTVKKAEDGGATVKRVPGEGHIPDSWDTSSVQDEKHPVLYVYKDYHGQQQVRWGRKPAKSDAAKKKDREKNKREKVAFRALAEWVRGTAFRDALARAADAYSSGDNFSIGYAFVLAHGFYLTRWPGFKYGVSSAANDMILDGSYKTGRVGRDWLEAFQASVADGIEHQNEFMAGTMMCLLPEAREALPPDQRRLIISDQRIAAMETAAAAVKAEPTA